VTSLKKYSQKRKFSGAKKTTEPKGTIRKTSLKKKTPSDKNNLPRFVVQKHDASHLHYDFRLEMSGVLKSWAVPKELPMEKGTKRLAIQVEDHPLSYSSFEGEIPEGNYGAGKVEIWDNGTYELIKKEQKEIEIILHGKKLNGKYVLIKTNYGKTEEQKKKSWLLFKVDD